MIVMYVYALVMTRYQRDTTPLSSPHLTNLVFEAKAIQFNSVWGTR